MSKEGVGFLEVQCESYKDYVNTFEKFLQYVQEDTKCINLNKHKGRTIKIKD